MYYFLKSSQSPLEMQDVLTMTDGLEKKNKKIYCTETFCLKLLNIVNNEYDNEG